MVHIILLGAPGAGKGTQAKILVEKLHLVHIATGDLFRQVAGEDTELSRTIKSYMEKGLLVPDEITINMLLGRMNEVSSARGVILDGFPRNLTQAKTLDAALDKAGEKIDKAVYIRVSPDELIRRLGGRWTCRVCQMPYQIISSPPRIPGKCDRCGGELYQRADDAPETVKKRLDVYFSETVSLIDYYRKKNKLVEVDGESDTEEVGQRIINALTVGGLSVA
ncbi:MAG: adenylate kinase [Chloroflexota bacterium]